MEYATHKLFRAGVLAAILAVTLCCALVFPALTGSDTHHSGKSAIAFTLAKAPASATNAGKCTQTADLTPVHAGITAPDLSTHELTVAGTPTRLSTPVTCCSGRSPPPAV